MTSRFEFTLSMILTLAITLAAVQPTRAVNRGGAKRLTGILGTQVMLPCVAGKGEDALFLLKITNTSGALLPAQTMIYYSTNIANGKELLANPFPSGLTKTFRGRAGDAAACQAWYFKK